MSLKISILGDNLESFIVCKALMASGIKISHVITSRENNKSDQYDLGEVAQIDPEILIVRIDEINADPTVREIQKLGSDVLYVLGWSSLIKKPLLESFRLGVVGSHPSPLPEGRGRAPLAWTILKGCRSNAVSLFWMDEKADNGDLLCQLEYEVPDRVTAEQLYRANAERLGEAFSIVHKNLCANKTKGVVQEASRASYRAGRIPQDGLIDFSSTAANIDKLIRAVSWPYPGAYCYSGLNRIVFRNSSVSIKTPISGSPGQVLARDRSGLIVQTGNGNITLSGIYRAPDENKWRFEDYEQLDPKSFRIGERLGYQSQDMINYLLREIAHLKEFQSK